MSHRFTGMSRCGSRRRAVNLCALVIVSRRVSGVVAAGPDSLVVIGLGVVLLGTAGVAGHK